MKKLLRRALEHNSALVIQVFNYNTYYRFTGVKDDQGYEYDYNPCNTFTDAAHTHCKDVYVSAYNYKSVKEPIPLLILITDLSGCCQYPKRWVYNC